MRKRCPVCHKESVVVIKKRQSRFLQPFVIPGCSHYVGIIVLVDENKKIKVKVDWRGND